MIEALQYCCGSGGRAGDAEALVRAIKVNDILVSSVDVMGGKKSVVLVGIAVVVLLA